MLLSVRQSEIMALAKEQGRVTVDDLAARFAVTPQTIRKDLNELCDSRALTRIHGGALFPKGNENVKYEARRSMAAAEKLAIGKAAARLIPDNASLFINIGTTTEAVGDALSDHKDLMVITNNINVANRLRVFPMIEVVIAGGVVRGSDGGIIGEAAVDFIRQFKVDFAVIGVSAIDEDGALLDFDFREVKVAQAIIANARHVILVSDSSKFERTAPVRIGLLPQIHTFITDHCPSDSIRAICRDHDVQLIETDQGEEGDPS
ncbi:DeoR/GlpR family DNA-binding transcription regulator [Rhizobium sp. SSA_523]|uniref:DeoR/GlpR family DNA-binding transcription regulator n=1 Tax=Rhizobium sp. SSA_523 TaxID=2952477 RepID=UPI0020918AA5|nr:DeoR/GlpR family DNA-binding transcription regulator [Rhizobium sp. SSA_523]MCO5733202.1 DeoR/GlpR family DNA-binding transcription regulator [Rhizobium sp. SSA_523]WKC21807.1 DeoR/GlpR family DNA-binding transcription regulator [Rhizobium sp. SSA_523]